MASTQLDDFCRRWLAAWTGNQPHALLSFYADDACYRDPAHPAGLKGREQLERYFVKLLAANPSWTWQPLEIVPTAAGCALKWRATIPTQGSTIVEEGLDLVEIRDGKITRNEVYFDRAALLAALSQPVSTIA